MGFIRQKGVTYCEPILAYNTAVLFTGADSVTRLINLHGASIQEWPLCFVPQTDTTQTCFLSKN